MQLMNYNKNCGTKYNEKTIEKLCKIYEDTQELIYTSYFNNVLYLIETIPETEEYKEKLVDFEKEINVDTLREKYILYKEKQLNKLDKKIITISRKNSSNTLAVISNNKLFAIFRAIRKIFIRE